MSARGQPTLIWINIQISCVRIQLLLIWINAGAVSQIEDVTFLANGGLA
jgi:hypothetical protein